MHKVPLNFGMYKLIGRIAVPCTNMMEWGKCLSGDGKIVAQIHIGPLFVSTVFLGIDHNYSDRGDPLIFETMIFGADESSEWTETYCERASTWGEAEVEHKKAVEYAKTLVEKSSYVLKEQSNGTLPE